MECTHDLIEASSFEQGRHQRLDAGFCVEHVVVELGVQSWSTDPLILIECQDQAIAWPALAEPWMIGHALEYLSATASCL